MMIYKPQSEEELGADAARLGAARIRDAIEQRRSEAIVVATGTSQYAMLSNLVREDIGWEHVTAFHLDEYVGLTASHPASFRNYLRTRFVAHVPQLAAFHEIHGEADPVGGCARLNALISNHRIDVFLAGIGENAHLAFNDPPADFEMSDPYIIVTLDEACRRQQVGEGWFPSVSDVPNQAISMSVRQIMSASCIVLSVEIARHQFCRNTPTATSTSTQNQRPCWPDPGVSK